MTSGQFPRLSARRPVRAPRDAAPLSVTEPQPSRLRSNFLRSIRHNFLDGIVMDLLLFITDFRFDYIPKKCNIIHYSYIMHHQLAALEKLIVSIYQHISDVADDDGSLEYVE